MPIGTVQALNTSAVDDDSPLSDQPQSPDGPLTVHSSSSSSAGTNQAVETLLALPNSGPLKDNRQSTDDRRYDEKGVETGSSGVGRHVGRRFGSGRSQGGRSQGGRSQGGRSGGGRNRRSRSEPGQSRGGRSEAGGIERRRNSADNSSDHVGEHNLVKFVALGRRLVYADIIQPSMKYAFASTVSENLKSYNSHERKKIGEAMKMAEKLAYPSAGRAIEFINAGAMNDVPVTAHDVARAYEAYGTPIPLLQGKTVHKTEHPYTSERLPRTISTVIQLHADIMFIEEIGFLITVSKPMDLVIITPLGKGTGVKSETSLRKALIGQYHVYWGKGFEINSVIMDGESAALKVAESMNGPPFHALASGVHNVVVESRIRRVKEGVRSILNGLPFKVSKVILVWAALYVVYVTNLMPKSKGSNRSLASP